MKSFFCKCWKTTLYLDTLGSVAVIAVSALLLLLAVPAATAKQVAPADSNVGNVTMVCPEHKVIAIALNTVPWPAHRPERVVRTIREQC